MIIPPSVGETRSEERPPIDLQLGISVPPSPNPPFPSLLRVSSVFPIPLLLRITQQAGSKHSLEGRGRGGSEGAERIAQSQDRRQLCAVAEEHFTYTLFFFLPRAHVHGILVYFCTHTKIYPLALPLRHLAPQLGQRTNNISLLCIAYKVFSVKSGFS